MAHPFRSHTPTLDTPAVSDTADQAPLTTERDAASLLKRPPAPTTKQARAAARAQAKAARLARRKALAEQRRRRGPVIPSFGLRGPGGAAGVVDAPSEYRATTCRCAGCGVVGRSGDPDDRHPHRAPPGDRGDGVLRPAVLPGRNQDTPMAIHTLTPTGALPVGRGGITVQGSGSILCRRSVRLCPGRRR